VLSAYLLVFWLKAQEGWNTARKYDWSLCYRSNMAQYQFPNHLTRNVFRRTSISLTLNWVSKT
jgi:hypothetical protein